MTHPANPFSALIDPATILCACAESVTLESLPVSARHSADRHRIKDAALAHHDAELDRVYADLIAKASRSSAATKARG